MGQFQGYGSGPPPAPIASWYKAHPNWDGPPPNSVLKLVGQSTSGTATGTTSAATSSSSPGFASSEKSGSHSVSHTLMPAIIVPVVVVLLGIAAVCGFLFLRRRKRAQREAVPQTDDSPPPQNQEMAMAAAAHNNLPREHRAAPQPPALDVNVPAAPVIISTHNDAYLTGLDTLSQNSGSRRNSVEDQPRRSLGGTTFAEPPPPYKASHDDDPSPEYEVPPTVHHDAGPVTLTRSPFGDSQEDIPVADGLRAFRSPFADPESPVSEIGSQHVGMRRDSDVSEL